MKLKILGASALVSVIAVGCGPPSVQDVSGAIGKSVRGASAQAAATTASVQNMGQLGDLAAGIGTFSGVMPRDAVPPLRPIAELPKVLLPSQLTQKLVPSTESDSVQRTGEVIAHYLETRIFTEANVESRTGDAIIFRITGEDVCTDGSFVADPACVTSFDRFEVRLRATRPDNTIQVTLLMGPDRDEPYELQVSNQFLAMRTDLHEVRDTILYVSSVVGSETVGLPQVMDGVIEVRATQGAGVHDFTLAISALEAINVQYTDPSSRSYSVSVAAGQDVGKLQFIEAERRVLVDLDLGAVDASFPNTFSVYDEGTGTTTTTEGQVAYHLGGASFSFDTREGAVELLVSNVGMGDTATTLALDGQQLVAINLNPNSARRFAIHVQRDLAGRPVYQFQSEVDLRAALNLAPLRAHGQEIPAWAEQDNLQVLFNGGDGGPTWRYEPYDAVSGFPGGDRVLTGTLTLSTDEEGVAPVVVNAGQCLVQQFPTDELGNPIEGHPFAVQYSSQACP